MTSLRHLFANFARWARSGSISRRLVLSVGLLCAFALGAATVLRLEDEDRLAQITRTTTSERQRLIGALVASDSRQTADWLRQVASRRDLLMRLGSPFEADRKTLEAALRPSMAASHVRALALYDVSGRHRLWIRGQNGPARWNALWGADSRAPRASYFARTPQGLVSVLTAPMRHNGRRVGTLVAVQPWSRAELDRLGRVTGTRIELVSRRARNEMAADLGQDRFHWFEELHDARGRPIAYRHFSANAFVVAQYRISVLKTQTFIVMLVGAFLAVVGAILGNYVGRPLRQMRRAIADGNTEGIQHLLEDSTEIGEQARVIENWLMVRGELLNSNEWLEYQVRDRMRELNEAYLSTIRALVTAMEYRDQETKGHCERVTEMAETLGRSIGLSESEIDDLRRGALLHDIGKIAIPDTVLLKPGALTPEERRMMETHAEIGFEMLGGIRFLERALDIPRYHHEKWDGTGYPQGVGTEDIPLAARIFALVDVWDALSSTRPYRKAWPPDRVREHIVALSGTHFDPTVVAAFERLPLDAFPTEFREDAGLEPAA